MIIRQNKPQTANPACYVVIYGECRSVCLILLTSTCCVSHYAERKSHFTVCIFVSLHDCSLLKVIKYCKLHKRGEKGREREMRGKAHLHLYLKWQMQMDQMIWQEENVNSSLQLFADRKKRNAQFSVLDRAFYIPTKCHPLRHLINHHGSILKFLIIFSNHSEQSVFFEILLVLFYHRNSVSSWLKGWGLWDLQFKDTFYSKAESKKRHNKLSLPALLSLFF